MRPLTTTIGPKVMTGRGPTVAGAAGTIAAADAAEAAETTIGTGTDGGTPEAAAAPGRATSWMLRRPFSSSTTRAKKSLNAVDSTPKRVATPGATARSMPRSESDFQLRSGRAVAGSRTIASGRAPPRSAVKLVARKSSTV